MQRISWWKKLLSYVTELHITAVPSDISGTLEISYKRGRYALCTPNAVYSYDDLYMNFRESFARLPLDEMGIQNVLVLGMGLGSIPILLEKTYKQRCQYTLVELDPVVIDLAKQYGCLAQGALKSPTEVVCADAAEWISQGVTHPKYQLIAIDIFVDDQTPSAVESIEFLEKLQKWLAPNGLIMYNRLTYNTKLMQKTYDFFEKKFKFVFKAAHFFKLNGNLMLLHRPV